MKTRQFILGLIAIAAVLVALLFWREKKQSAEVSLPISIPASAVLPTIAASNVAAVKTVTSSIPQSASTVANQVKLSTSQDRVTMAKEVLQANDVNIVFYGRLEDQFGNPVTGVDINFNIQYENVDARGVRRGHIKSDSNGIFTISGTGANLGIVPQKDGYVLATTGTSFRYSQLTPGYFIPDASKPTVIKMWKLQGAEPLTSIDKHYKLHFISSPINFDLLTGEIVPSGGDIKITVERASGVISGRNKLDWGLRIEAVDGGIMDSGGQDDVTYAAPETGYIQNLDFLFSTNAPNKWAEGFDHGFFVMSRNGQVYSKLGFSFRINQAPDGFMYIILSGVANGNRSRNWEAAIR